jgi:hypothetical protein
MSIGLTKLLEKVKILTIILIEMPYVNMCPLQYELLL